MISNLFSSRISDDYLQKLARRAIRKFSVPAVAISVMDSRQVLAAHLEGVRILDGSDPATINDFFHIGSCAKSILATIAGRLVDEERLQWETRIFDVLPELEADSDPAYRRVSLEDLFLCEAGIKPYTSNGEEFPELKKDDETGRLQFVSFLLQQPPSVPQKENGKFPHLYSNAGYTIISEMLQRVLGVSYNEMIATFAGQLGEQIRPGWPNRIAEDQPWGHIITSRQTIKLGPDHEYALPDPIAPAGDLSMTPPGFSRYIQAHLAALCGAEDENPILENSTCRKIHFGYRGFALGVGNGTLHGVEFSGINGSAGTFFSQAILVPGADFALAIMINAGSGGAHMPVVEWLSTRLMAKKFNWWWKALT